MTLRNYLAAILLACLLAAASGAHHSATQYDNAKRVTLTGTFTGIDWRNPHIEFTLEVKGDSGQSEIWLVETVPPNRLVSRNITKSDFQKAVGQSVTLVISPTRDGSRYGILRKITFADGNVVDCGDLGVSSNCKRVPRAQE